jgi:Zn-dependent M28 family amino/carboxypeptidase
VNGDAIYNGAIDNATGVGVILESRASLHRCGKRLAGPLLFAFWTAEESGLRGADTTRIILSCPPLRLLSTSTSTRYSPSPERATSYSREPSAPALALAQQTAKAVRSRDRAGPRPEQGSYYRSDHFMMARIGVPAFKVGLGPRSWANRKNSPMRVRGVQHQALSPAIGRVQ